MYLRKYFRRKAFIIVMFMLFAGLTGGIILTEFNFIKKIEPARATFFDISAGTGDNVDGFAWSPNFGWISFNSSDCDIDGQGDFGDVGAPAGCPDADVAFYDYGVSIEMGTGIFSGYAWTSNLGWIYFGPDANLGAPYGNILAADAPAAPSQWATYDYNTKMVKGWANVLSLGNDGWILFNGAWTEGVGIDIATSEFSGFAWNGNSSGTGIGWISFNCSDTPLACDGGSNPGALCTLDTECLDGGTCEGTCSLSDYKVNGVVNRAPTAIDLVAPYLADSDLCHGVTNSVLKWKFEDEDLLAYESAYKIIFDDDPDPSLPLFETPKCTLSNTNASCQIMPGVGQYPIHNMEKLDYDEHYYWWVKVWDEYDVESEWATSTVWGADFVVPGHELPAISVDSFFPTMPSAGEEIKFNGSSSIYRYSAPGVAVPCTNDGINCSWLWSVVPSYYSSINDPATTTPLIILDNSEQAFSVYLSVTDKDGYTCTSEPMIVNPQIELPTWIEIKTEE